ncbi:MAG TPA: TetR family transcriptional regulator [Acidimicrobiales bacterium]
MNSVDVAAAPAGSPPLSAAQARIVDAAVRLFAEHGVGGTSLGMIAKALGVTKAAVYHQFRTKHEIVLAVAETELARLEAAIDLAEAQPTPDRARQVLVTRIVELAIENRRAVSSILNDPVIVRLFAEHESLRRVLHRLRRILIGDGAAPGARVSTAVLTAAISGAVVHPLVVDLDDDTLRAHLMDLARRIFELPG